MFLPLFIVCTRPYHLKPLNYRSSKPSRGSQLVYDTFVYYDTNLERDQQTVMEAKKNFGIIPHSMFGNFNIRTTNMPPKMLAGLPTQKTFAISRGKRQVLCMFYIVDNPAFWWNILCRKSCLACQHFWWIPPPVHEGLIFNSWLCFENRPLERLWWMELGLGERGKSSSEGGPKGVPSAPILSWMTFRLYFFEMQHPPPPCDGAGGDST